MKRKGSTFIETIVTLFIISFFLNPIYKSITFFQKEFSRISIQIKMENEMEKLRAFYKREDLTKESLFLDKEFILDKTLIPLDKNINKIVLKLNYKNQIERECIIYVYKQK